MVAVDARRDSCRGQVAGHELEESHLGRRILHGHSIGLELEVCGATDVLSILCTGEEGLFGIIKM